MENGEEEMLMAEDHGPDLIHSQKFRKQCSISRSSLAYYRSKEEEREHLIAHESLDYLPSHSTVYKKWLQEKTYRKEWDRWLLMGLIGTAVGVLGFLIHQIIDSLIKLKWDLVENYLQDGNIHMTWLCALGLGLAMVVLSSGSVLVKNLLDMNVLAFIPTILLGMLGGLLGALFVSLNIKINKLRMRFFNSIPKLSLRKTSKLLETVLILVLQRIRHFVLLSTATRHLNKTPVFKPAERGVESPCVTPISPGINQFKRKISEYSCSSSTWIGPDGVRYSNQTFNQAAALLIENGKQGIMYLFKRGTHEEFGYASLCTALTLYFILSCWTAGSAVASGLVIPMLYTGALYGRIIGLILVSIFGVQTNEYGAWIDPGLFAAIGAASFFSGVSRLTISLTVIMVEITNDVQSLLLIMLAVMVAKMVGDLFNTSLYSSLLKLKLIPYLDVEPFVHHRRKWLNLELFSARDVMEPGVRVLHLKENIASLARLLASTSHGGFPVVCRPKPDHAEVFQGTIKRLELCMLLENEHIFEPETNDDTFSSSHPLSYEKITVEKLPDLSRLTMLLNRYATDPQYQQLFINLEPYINKSAMSVQAHFSLQRTYIIFRTLGLRHLTVVDQQNRVVGVITRKDLMPFPLEEKLRLQLAPQSPDAGEQTLDSRPWMHS
ncbi:chloride channel protein c-like [Limosa lapponica baueri]|uniref:Chloride channel protein n=1 Tax=Limosa lapponica baueri TaxID=1758121 RepID=A0A2I0TUL7_LIMLA|nr:chloride channel protein c-like [Limosa lapponica baueri]